MFDLLNVFESFLPQLLAYPNPIDPLNGDAAALYLHKPEDYKKKVQDYVHRYATEDALKDGSSGTSSRGHPSNPGSSRQPPGSEATNGTTDTTPAPANGTKKSANGTTGNGTKEAGDESDSSESSMSDFSEDEAQDMEL